MDTGIYKAIAAVSLDLSKEGIAKDRKNDQQGYKFRGIDDVYNALAPIIARHGLVILPRILSRVVTERTTAKGGVLFYVVVEAEFDFVASSDGSRHVVRTYGEAMDSADKATNKAMSAAYKYAAFQTFCIPTEGNNDADSTTHDIVAQAPAGYDDWLIDIEAVAMEGTEALRAAWKTSKVEHRQHLTSTNSGAWEALKVKAERASKEMAHA
jgi:hypothetical protein